MGRALGNNLLNLWRIQSEVKEALEELGIDLNLHSRIRSRIQHLETVVLDVLQHASLIPLLHLDISAYGCGIRYRYGMFKQEIRDGYQVEVPDSMA